MGAIAKFGEGDEINLSDFACNYSSHYRSPKTQINHFSAPWPTKLPSLMVLLRTKEDGANYPTLTGGRVWSSDPIGHS